MVKFYITAEEMHTMVAGLAHCMSKETARYYLNGICLENDPRSGLTAIATDGHRCGTLRMHPVTVDGVSEAIAEAFNVILPTEAVTWMGGLPQRFTGQHLLTVEIDSGKVKLSLFPTMISGEFTLVDGTFPDWRRAAPHEHTPSVSFDVKYVLGMARAIKKNGGKRFTLSIVDSSAPAVITSNNNIRVMQYVLMPMRVDTGIIHSTNAA